MNSTIEISPVTLRTRASLQQQIRHWRAAGETIGFVPTMGALHNGHLSLLEKAREKASRTVASIFVNPAQFAPGEDFERYPRDEAGDLARLGEARCDAVYLPSVAEMYPPGTMTHVRVDSLSDALEGRFRPHFFYGVTTVVARLFLHVQPDVAVFGEKDFQQLQIIRRMVRDLGFPIEIIAGETRRESDGLAMSSRNAYLSAGEREIAGTLFSALHRAKTRLEIGASAGEVLAEAADTLARAGFGPIDYVSLVDPETFDDLPETPLMAGTQARLLAAAWLGRTRLIDNVGVSR